MADSDAAPPIRVSRAQRLIETRLANPLFRRLLRSRLHWPASRWLVLLSYVGRRSGRRYAIPVAYHGLDDALVVVTPRHESDWWRNFRTPRNCTLWLRGSKRAASGVVVTGDERASPVAAYLRHHRVLARVLVGDGRTDGDGTPSRSGPPHPDLAVVRFSVDDGRGRRF